MFEIGDDDRAPASASLVEVDLPAAAELAQHGALTLGTADLLEAADLAPLALSPPRDRNPAAVFLARLAPGSRPTMAQALRVVTELALPGSTPATVPWAQWRYPHSAACRSTLAATYAPASANKILAALRGVLKETWRLGMITGEDFQRAIDFERVPGMRLPAGRALAQGELQALFAKCDASTPGGAQHAAILAILFGGGLRRAEAASLDVDSVQLDGALKVLGKGGRQRLVPLPEGSRRALAAWMAHRGAEPDPLLCPVSKGGEIRRRRLTAQAIYRTVKRLPRQADVPRIGPHDFRRTTATRLLDAGADLAIVQRIMGHASPATTARSYDRRGDAEAQKAVEKLDVPFGRDRK